ncbi:MAG: hypothetical protein OEU92_02290 [Alphaproteobacteria bacterium]|nr:hypothetical protein [Alphaproteobacteria bacterium]
MIRPHGLDTPSVGRARLPERRVFPIRAAKPHPADDRRHGEQAGIEKNYSVV